MGRIIQEQLRYCNNKLENYPPAEDIDIDKLQTLVPEVLQAIVCELFVSSRTNKANLKKKLIQSSISHVYASCGFLC